MKNILKDEKLNKILLKNNGNIAKFVSFGLEKELRYTYIDKKKNIKNISNKKAIIELINASKSKVVNIRTYSPKRMKGNKLIFDKNIDDIDEIMSVLEENKQDGMFSIVNENIDIHDGGVSGVVLGDLIEFAPKDTPKCVDKEGVCSLPRDLGYKLLEKIYGFRPEINFNENYRVEFSIHPSRQGFLNEHTIIWEYEYYNEIPSTYNLSWPNNFSKFIGDKVFGLLIADLLSLNVPKTTVISRNLAPFTFGRTTGLYEKWIRTAPIFKEPGKYYTGDRWVDPFILIEEEEEKKGKERINIASVLSQDAVDPLYSGASIIKKNSDQDIIEGVAGKGDKFMVGEELNKKLPDNVLYSVEKLNSKIRDHYNLLGEVSIEWVYDGKNIWVVQLNQIKSSSSKNIIVEGNPKKYIKFDISLGLEELRRSIDNIDSETGIDLVGEIGITSHFGDLLRIAEIPSRLKRS